MEDMKQYRPGGWHPVHIGDSLKNDRYVIINKLGYGRDSLVWLAEDHGSSMSPTCVAISILRASLSIEAETQGITVLQYLSQCDPANVGFENLLLAKDSFEISGPNGIHLCIVSKVQGPSIASATNRIRGVSSKILPMHQAKKAIWDLVKGLSCIHACGVVHGDLHPGNLLLSFPDNGPNYLSPSKASLLYSSPIPSSFAEVGDISAECAPRYVVAPAVFKEHLDSSFFSGPLTICDWGGSFFEGEAPSNTSHLGPYMVPEFCSTGHIFTAMDVWMLGCAMYQILSGWDLFGRPDDSPKTVLTAMMKILGPPPEYLFEAWKGFVPEICFIEQPLYGSKVNIVETKIGNRVLAIASERGDVSVEELDALCTLLLKMLVYEPTHRPTMADILGDPAMRSLVGTEFAS